MTIQTESISCTYEMGTEIKSLGFKVSTDKSNELYSRDLLKATPSEWSKVFLALMTIRATTKASEKASLTSVCKRVLAKSDISADADRDASEKYQIVRAELDTDRVSLRQIKTYLLSQTQTWKF
tara:strand:+ start:520 stop:891 length:372 start_codon:yes stop_codon:yes gene_type:complete